MPKMFGCYIRIQFLFDWLRSATQTLMLKINIPSIVLKLDCSNTTKILVSEHQQVSHNGPVFEPPILLRADKPNRLSLIESYADATNVLNWSVFSVSQQGKPHWPLRNAFLHIALYTCSFVVQSKIDVYLKVKVE